MVGSMEKELLETFEVAKKAADAAADGGGPSEGERCVDALRRLRKIPVTIKDLVDTQVGKRLRFLTKHSHEKIRALASDLLQFWKNVVIEETSKDNKKNNMAPEKNSLQVEGKSEQADTVKIEKMSMGDMVSRSESIKVERISSEKGIKADNLSRFETVKVEKNEASRVEKINGGETVLVETISREENKASVTEKPTSAAVGLPKLTSIIKCNNPARDKLREILAEAFSRVPEETLKSKREEVRNIWDEVNACDPIRVAVTVESAMFERLGSSTGMHKMKYRSIMFNLKDGKNTDFRRRVLLGHVRPEKLVDMTPEEMASDERKLANQQIKEKALFECERGSAPKATTDQFKCGRCGQRKTTYYQLQTRSADEPMTTFVTCVNCNNHWKFC